MGDGDSSKSTVAWLTLGVTVIGLVATNIWSYFQFDDQAGQLAAQQASSQQQAEALAAQKEELAGQREELRNQEEALDLQKDQLEQAIAQFEESHGVLQLKAQLNIHDIESGTWMSTLEEQNPFYGQTLGPEAFTDHVYVQLSVTNVGTGPTQVRAVGLLIDDSDTIYADPPSCGDPETGVLRACPSPLTVDAQSVVYVFVPVSTDRLHCNEYVDAHGIVGAVRTVDDDLLSQATGTRVSFSGECP